MIRCLHCGAETSNGLALCELCRRAVMVNLEFIAVYFRNLSRWRPGRAGTRDVPGSREPRIPLPTEGDAVSRALDESHADLTGWARSLADDRPGMARVIERILGCDEEPTARLLCVLFARRIDSLSTLEWIGEFARVPTRIAHRPMCPGLVRRRLSSVRGPDVRGARPDVGDMRRLWDDYLRP
jgi:hypothetical protein